jgi:predicted TPR repeat methyltransferase
MTKTQAKDAALHDAYAADYDAQVQSYDCHIADLLFGLCYEFVRPGQRLLDAGIGSGLSAQLFAEAGLEVYGMDFSPAMLAICQSKGIVVDLKLHDLTQSPWPYPAASFDHVVCCGVLHFIPELDGIFDEAARVLVSGGVFAFTTRQPPGPVASLTPFERHTAGDFEIFSHTPAYVEALLAQHGYTAPKTQRCFVGDDVFAAWIAGRQ